MNSIPGDYTQIDQLIGGVSIYYIIDQAIQVAISVTLFSLFILQAFCDKYHSNAPNYYRILHWCGMFITFLCVVKSADPQAVMIQARAWVIFIHLLKALTIVLSTYFIWGVCYMSIMCIYASKSGDSELPRWFTLTVIVICISALFVAIVCEMVSFIICQAFVLGIYFCYVGVGVFATQFCAYVVYKGLGVMVSSPDNTMSFESRRNHSNGAIAGRRGTFIRNGSSFGTPSITTDYTDMDLALKKRIELAYALEEKMRYKTTLKEMLEKRKCIDGMISLAAVFNIVIGVSIIYIGLHDDAGRNLSDPKSYNIFRDSNYGSDYFVYTILCITLWHSWLPVRCSPERPSKDTHGGSGGEISGGELSQLSSSSARSVSRLSFATARTAETVLQSNRSLDTVTISMLTAAGADLFEASAAQHSSDFLLPPNSKQGSSRTSSASSSIRESSFSPPRMSGGMSCKTQLLVTGQMCDQKQGDNFQKHCMPEQKTFLTEQKYSGD